MNASLADAKEMLSCFITEARDEDIWVSMKAFDLNEQNSDAKFCQVLGAALDIAKRNCLNSSFPTERMIMIHSCNLQRRIFLKIRYSSQDGNCNFENEQITSIRNMVEGDRGYFNIQPLENAVDIKIALPIH